MTRGRRGGRRKPSRLGPLATVAAWLRLWTPPRDAVVPPVPWRALALGTLALVALGAAVWALAAPRIETAKEERAAALEEASARSRGARRRRAAAEQRPHSAQAPDLRLGGGAQADPAATLRARQALLGRLEREIGRDVRARVAHGLLRGPVLRVDCAPEPGSAGAERDLGRARAAYGCTAVTSAVAEGRGALGHPFRAVVDFERATMTWCKVNPLPGERAVPDPRTIVPLSRSCTRA